MFTGEKVSNFQQRFTQLVEESGKSLLKLSKELHISNQALSTWRSGIRSPKEPTIVAVADYFGVNVQWLLGFDVEKCMDNSRSIVIPDTELFRKILLNMTPEDYKTVMEIFERTNLRMKENGLL